MRFDRRAATAPPAGVVFPRWDRGGALGGQDGRCDPRRGRM